MAYPYATFKKTYDYNKPSTNLKKEDYFPSLTNEAPDNETTNEIKMELNLKAGQDLSEIKSTSNVLLLVNVFRKYVSDSEKTYALKPLDFLSV